MNTHLIIMCICITMSLCSIPSIHAQNLTDMLDKIDQLDATDFADLIKKARQCSETYEFRCAEESLKKARNLASTKAARIKLKDAELHFTTCRTAYEERQRRIAEAKREEQERARLESERLRRNQELAWQRQEEQERLAQEEQEEQRRETEERRREERLARQRRDNAEMAQAWNETSRKLERMNKDIASMGSNWKNPFDQVNKYNQERAEEAATERRRQQQRERNEYIDRERDREQRRVIEEAAERRRQEQQEQSEYASRARSRQEQPERRIYSATSGGESTESSRKAAVGKIAIVATWKNTNDYWFAAGPVQSTQIGERDEKKAIEFTVGKGALSYVGQLGKYKIYKLDRVLERHEEDVRRLLNREGLDPFTIDQSL